MANTDNLPESARPRNPELKPMRGRLDVEHQIRPPLARAITVPVLVNGRDVGIAIYVTASPFCPVPVSDATLRAIAKRLTFTEEDR
jgi:hypothetical protein